MNEIDLLQPIAVALPPADGAAKFSVGGRLPAAVSADTADSGRIKTGACGRLPAERSAG